MTFAASSVCVFYNTDCLSVISDAHTAPSSLIAPFLPHRLYSFCYFGRHGVSQTRLSLLWVFTCSFYGRDPVWLQQPWHGSALQHSVIYNGVWAPAPLCPPPGLLVVFLMEFRDLYVWYLAVLCLPWSWWVSLSLWDEEVDGSCSLRLPEGAMQAVTVCVSVVFLRLMEEIESASCSWVYRQTCTLYLHSCVRDTRVLLIQPVFRWVARARWAQVWVVVKLGRELSAALLEGSK